VWGIKHSRAHGDLHFYHRGRSINLAGWIFYKWQNNVCMHETRGDDHAPIQVCCPFTASGSHFSLLCFQPGAVHRYLRSSSQPRKFIEHAEPVPALADETMTTVSLKWTDHLHRKRGSLPSAHTSICFDTSVRITAGDYTRPVSVQQT